MKVGITSSLDVVSPSFQSCANACYPDKATTSINLFRVSPIVLTIPSWGSKADIQRLRKRVCFTPKSGRVGRNQGCPLWAISGHVRCTNRCPLYPDSDRESRHDRHVNEPASRHALFCAVLNDISAGNLEHAS